MRIRKRFEPKFLPKGTTMEAYFEFNNVAQGIHFDLLSVRSRYSIINITLYFNSICIS